MAGLLAKVAKQAEKDGIALARSLLKAKGIDKPLRSGKALDAAAADRIRVRIKTQPEWKGRMMTALGISGPASLAAYMISKGED